jgi:hypothetical protein
MELERMTDQDRRYHVSHYYVLNKEKIPVPCADEKAWRHWMQNANRVLRRTGNDRTYVATVFLGIDEVHAKRKGSYVDPPLLFEVRVFRNNISDGCELFSTWVEADDAHDYMARELIAINSGE